MELNEALRRIVLQHWRLIALLLVACVGAAAVLHHSDSTTYTSSTRLVLDTQDPQSSTGSTVIGDTARAIATSPVEIRQALDAAGIRDRNPIDVSKHVSVSPLGTSGVLQLSVSDSSRTTAEKLANQLALRVIETRSAVNSKAIRAISKKLDTNIRILNQKIADNDLQIDRLQRQLATGVTGDSAVRLRQESDSISRVRDFEAQQRGVLVSERLGLLSTEALRPQASVISRATHPFKPDASRTVSDLVLGALLGLVLGLGSAALLETLRPRLHGGDVLARELQTSHLGVIPANAAEQESGWSPEPIALVLRLAAQGAGVRHVSLLAAEPFPGLGAVAKRVEAASNRSNARPERVPAGAYAGDFEGLGQRTATATPAVRVRPFGIDAPAMNNGAGTGIAVVAPESLTRLQLVELTHLLSVMPLPVLGVITYRPARRFSARLGLGRRARAGLGNAWDSPAQAS